MEIGWPTSVRHVAFEPEGSQKRSSHTLVDAKLFISSKMDDPMTGLMYAVQVMMNFLKMLIKKTLRERQDSVVEEGHVFPLEPSDESSENQSLSSEESTLDNNARTSDSGQMETEIKSSVLAPAQWPVGKRIDQPEPCRFEGRAY
ncbi:hypothetical protein F2Q68_00022224 [Brassica cretica]|uniref:Uncharacterized protein n=1 Tax=Brassica cretica TaxID=69181 RepID=A0A8S9FZS9_BRACR|nr:hypothetical protein F2Q68_00022224 [Brassica cretica]